MAFGNFWRGGGRERFGSERDQDRNRDRWRTTGSDWRDDERSSGNWDRDRDEYGSREYGGREGRYGSSVTSDWERGDEYGGRSRNYGGGYGGGRQGYGGERYRGQSEGYGSEYDYRGGSLYGGGYGRGSGSYGTAGSYEQGSREQSRFSQPGSSGYGSESYSRSQGQSMRGRGPRNYQRSDERIREDVCECLTVDDLLDASAIEVTVTDGEVVLSGLVFERDAKRRAEDLSEGVSGVKDVRNNLRVSNEQQSQQSTSGQTKGAQ